MRDTGRVRVLVVDDEEAVRSALTHALQRDGYEVSTAADGITALATLLRRSGAGADLMRFADIELDLAARRASRGGERLTLTKTELALLELFLRNPGRVLSRAQILESVWGYDFGPESNGLWVYISYLRRKMGEPRLIQTVRGLGYVLREEK